MEMGWLLAEGDESLGYTWIDYERFPKSSISVAINYFSKDLDDCVLE